MTKSDEGIALFFKYALFIPVILTLFLEILQYSKIINIDWIWMFSPIWIWILGAFQFMIGGMLTEFFESKKK